MKDYDKKWKPGQLVTIGYKLCRVTKHNEKFMNDYRKYFSHLAKPKTKIPEDCYLVTIAWNIKHPSIQKSIQRRKSLIVNSCQP